MTAKRTLEAPEAPEWKQRYETLVWAFGCVKRVSEGLCPACGEQRSDDDCRACGHHSLYVKPYTGAQAPSEPA